MPPERQIVPATAPSGVPPGRATRYTQRPKARNGWRWIPRIVLYLPRRIIDLVTIPLEHGLLMFQKHRVRYRVLDVFFDRRRTFGIVPTAFAETGLGLNGGMRVIHQDLFGHRESLNLRLAWGGLYRHVYEARFGLGDLLGPTLDLSFDVRHSVRPRMRFFGIGNDDEVGEDGELPTPLALDPVSADIAVDTRYSVDDTRWGAELGILLRQRLRASISHRWTFARFGLARAPSDSYQISKIFDPAALVGWNEGLFNHYTELSLQFTDLRTRYPWISTVTPSSGWSARIYGGAAAGIRGDPTELLTSGGEVARFFDLHAGDRVLVLKATLDAVHGRRDRIPFTAYPTLGGPTRLRGYVRDRFRDRFSTLLTLEYRFPVNPRTTGFLFSDVGSVWPQPWIIDFEDLDHLRATFGGGAIFYIGDVFVTKIQLAGSVDGTFAVFFGL